MQIIWSKVFRHGFRTRATWEFWLYRPYVISRNVETGRQRQTERQTDRETNRQTETKAASKISMI